MDDYKLIEDKKAEMANVFGRMQADEDLYFLTPYQMMQLPPNHYKPMPDVVNVTLNDPLLFANKAISILGGASMQTVVEGRDMTDKATTKVEEFLEDIYYMIDERLGKRGIIGLDGYINEQICIRGRIAARACIRLDEKGNIVPDVLPVDTISFVYDTDDNGLTWAAATFRRSKSQIEKEYGKQIGSEYGEVTDLWKQDTNIVFVDREVVKEQENPYGKPPFVLSICPAGSQLSTAEEHQGESILWMNRGLWSEKNRTASILQTLNVMSLFNSLQYESSKGEAASKPAESPFGPRKVNPVEPGRGYKPMPINDIKNATRLFYAVLDASLQKGSLSVIDYGTLTFPLSAVAITRLSASRDDIFLPRLQAKAVFYQALSQMIIDECKGLGKSMKIGQPGNQNTYSKSDLNGDYTIKYRFYTQTKEQDIADLSIANAAQGFLSSDTIRREVLKLKDPDGEEAKFLSEQAEKTDEVLFLYRRASKLIEDGEPLQAYILAKRIVTTLKQRQQMSAMAEQRATQNTPQETGRSAAQQLLPLFAGGGGGAPRARSAQIPSEPNETTEVESE